MAERMVGWPALSLNQLTVRDLDFRTLAYEARTAGFGGVGVLPTTVDELGPDRVLGALVDEGLVATSVCAFIGLTGADRAQQAERLVEALAAVDQAAALTAPLVVVVGGPALGLELAAAATQVRDGLEVVLARGAELGVDVLVEPLHPVLVNLSVVTSVVSALDSVSQWPNAGVVLDTWHVWAEPGLLATVEAAVRSIRIVHLSDWATHPPGTLDRELPGKGLAELPRLCATLLRAGFSGWWEVEVLSEAYWHGDQRELVHQAYESGTEVLRRAAELAETEPCVPGAEVGAGGKV